MPEAQIERMLWRIESPMQQLWLVQLCKLLHIMDACLLRGIVFTTSTKGRSVGYIIQGTHHKR